jgi:hypothetical protein
MAPESLDEIRRTFVAFREECIWVQTCFNTFQALYHGGLHVDALLHRSAATFFKELNIVLVEYWVLIVCRLTDRARTRGDDNLTAKYLVEALTQHNLMTSGIREVAHRLDTYRELIDSARNKLVSHADKAAFLRSVVLGEHTKEAVEQFVRDLQRFNDLVGEVVGEGPLDYQTTSCPGDVHDLLRVLKNATESRPV